MGKRRRGLMAPFILAIIMIAAITVVLINRFEGMPEKIIAETDDEKSLEEVHRKYMLTDPAGKLEIQESEISYEPETLKSNQLEDIIGGVFLYALSKYTKMGLLKKVLTVLVIIIAIAAYSSGE